MVSFEQGVLAVAFAVVVLMVITAFAKSTGGSSIRGGKIGEPDHEVTIVPAEEPVPKPTPVPSPAPVREPVPHRRPE